MHLLQRTYGTMILAAPDPEAARALVDQAEATMGDKDACSFCIVMLAVPSAIACAEVGDLDQARHYARVAEASAVRWPGTAWGAAATEARAHIARAESSPSDAAALFTEAARGFEAAGQPGDAARCLRSLESLQVSMASRSS